MWRAIVVPADLSADGAADALVRRLADTRIDALVNNAGFSTYGVFAHEDPATLRRDAAREHGGADELTRACVPPMVERRWGRVLMLGSVGSFTPAPMTAAYAATKAYVLSFSLAWRRS